MKRKELAELLGVDKSTLSRWRKKRPALLAFLNRAEELENENKLFKEILTKINTLIDAQKQVKDCSK